MSGQKTLCVKSGFTKSMDHKGLQRDVKIPDIGVKMQKTIKCSYTASEWTV